MDDLIQSHIWDFVVDIIFSSRNSRGDSVFARRKTSFFLLLSAARTNAATAGLPHVVGTLGPTRCAVWLQPVRGDHLDGTVAALGPSQELQRRTSGGVSKPRNRRRRHMTRLPPPLPWRLNPSLRRRPSGEGYSPRFMVQFHHLLMQARPGGRGRSRSAAPCSADCGAPRPAGPDSAARWPRHAG